MNEDWAWCASCGKPVKGFVYKQGKLKYDEVCFLKLELPKEERIPLGKSTMTRRRIRRELEDAEAIVSMLNDTPLYLVRN